MDKMGLRIRTQSCALTCNSLRHVTSFGPSVRHGYAFQFENGGFLSSAEKGENTLSGRSLSVALSVHLVCLQASVTSSSSNDLILVKSEWFIRIFFCVSFTLKPVYDTVN